MLYSSSNQGPANPIFSPTAISHLTRFTTQTKKDESGSMQKVSQVDTSSSSVTGSNQDTRGQGDLTRQNLERFRQSLKEYPRWDADRRRRAIGRVFHHNVTEGESYKEALFDAARQRKPVVLMFGKTSDPATRQVVENSLKDSRDRSGNQAIFVFIDMDEVDSDSPPGRYAAGVTGKHGYPITICFTMTPGDAYNPARSEVPGYHQTGPVTAERLHEAIGHGKLVMANRDFPHVPLAEADRPRERTQAKLTLSRELIQQLKPTAEPAREIPYSAQLVMEARSLQKEDKKTSYELFCQAIAVADQSSDASLKSAARAELGIACIGWKFPEKGFAWLLDAGKCYPDVYRNEKFADRLRQAGLPPATIQILLQEGQRNPTWYESDKEQAIERLQAPMRFLDHRPVPLELSSMSRAETTLRTGEVPKQPSKGAQLAAIQLTGSEEEPARQQKATRGTTAAETLPDMQLTRPTRAAQPNRFASPFGSR